MNKPTDKQINCIIFINKTLGLNFDTETATKKEAFDFIGEYQNKATQAFKSHCNYDLTGDEEYNRELAKRIKAERAEDIMVGLIDDEEFSEYFSINDIVGLG